MIKYRPMLVKEYKALLHAQDLGDDSGFINTIRGIIDDCLFNKVEIDDLPMYVIDYIFLRIRAKSVGETVTAEYRCNHTVEKPAVKNEDGTETPAKIEPCGCRFQVIFNLEDAFVKFPLDFNKKCIIQVTDNIGIRLKSPTFRKFRSVGIEGKGILDITDEYVFSCLDSVFEGDKVMVPGVDFTLDELRDFLESFPSNKVEELTEFFRNQPAVTMIMELTCPSCRNKTTVELNGLKDFFE